EPPHGAFLELEDRSELLGGRSCGLRLANCVEHVRHRRGGALDQSFRAPLDRLDLLAKLILRHVVAGLAGVVEVEERASHPMGRDLHRALPLVGHVAIRATDAASRVDALAPKLELGMLRLVDRRTGLAVSKVEEGRAVGEEVIVVDGLDLLDRETLRPGEEERLLGGAVILDVTLPADEAPHLLAGRVDVRIVAPLALALAPTLDAREMRQRDIAFRERRDAEHEPRARDAKPE